MTTTPQPFRNATLWITAAALLLQISVVTRAEPVGFECVSISDRFFDPKAKRLGQFGAVLVEYSINAKGEAERVVILKSTASRILGKAATRVIRDLRCKPTEDWSQSGGPQRRLKVNVIFQYKGGEPVPLIDPAEDVITISTEKV